MKITDLRLKELIIPFRTPAWDIEIGTVFSSTDPEGVFVRTFNSVVNLGSPRSTWSLGDHYDEYPNFENVVPLEVELRILGERKVVGKDEH